MTKDFEGTVTERKDEFTWIVLVDRQYSQGRVIRYEYDANPTAISTSIWSNSSLGNGRLAEIFRLGLRNRKLDEDAQGPTLELSIQPI